MIFDVWNSECVSDPGPSGAWESAINPPDDVGALSY